VQLIYYQEAYKDPGEEDFLRRVLSIDTIGQAVGWEPKTSLNETIDQIIDYYRENT
jgi:nucleoside-diphosphate-sugar epimerase